MIPSPDGDADRFERLRSVADATDTDQLKRVGVITYFGVYAVIAVGGWRALVGLTQRVPQPIRPPALAPLHVLLELPRSLAWGFISIGITLVTLGGIVAVQTYRAQDDPPSLGGEQGLRARLPTPGGSRDRSLRAQFAARSGDKSLRARLPASSGDRSLRARLPSSRELRARAPPVPRPEFGALRSRLPSPPEFVHERAGSPAVRLQDGSLSAPADPLALPRSTAAVRSAVDVPKGHAVAEGVTAHRDRAADDTADLTEGGEWAVSEGTGTEHVVHAAAGVEMGERVAVDAGTGSEMAVAGGESEPAPDAPWPAETESDGEDGEDDPDASAPWPGGWRGGDEL